MDPATLEKGKALQEVLMMFKQSTTSPLSPSILKAPKHKIALTKEMDERGRKIIGRIHQLLLVRAQGLRRRKAVTKL
jgi:hypothetical protein